MCHMGLVNLTPFHSVHRDESAQLADVFLKKGPYLKMYSTYIREFDKNVALLEEHTKRNPAFGAVVREFEVTRPVRPVLSVWGRCVCCVDMMSLFMYVCVCVCVCVC